MAIIESLRSRAKSAFTLIELLLVLALIAILATIAVVGWNRSLREAAAKDAVVARRSLAGAIEAFRNTKGGRYPKTIQDKIDQGKTGIIYFSESETKSIIEEIVKESESGNTLVDVTKLKVEADGDPMTYTEARRDKLSIGRWGYICGSGNFRPFYIYLNASANNKIGFYYKMRTSSDNIEFEKKDLQCLLLDTAGNEVSVSAAEREIFE